MGTSVLVFAASNLQQLAWGALLKKQPSIELSGTVRSLSELDHRTREREPATVLVDLPQIGPELVARIRASVPGAGLLFLVDEYDLSAIVNLLRAGAAGCLIRDASVSELARAIIAAGRDEIVLPPDLATRALVALARGESAGERSSPSLTEREREVLTLLARGLTNKNIAQTLILSVRTVEAHLRNVFDKLDVGSRTEAALWAVNHGFGPDE